MSTKKKEPVPAGEQSEKGPQAEAVETAAVEEAAAVEAPSPERKLAEELAAEKEKYLRLLAEYDNYRKRSVRERDNIYADVKADTLIRLLPVYDNLARALAQETADEAYRKGVEMTMNQFLETLAALGVTPIEAVGKAFDPALHNAVMHIEDDDHGEGEVVQEFQRGFKMGERVIRFAAVQVAN